jgi:uncharacterized membrane protein YhdT
MAALRLILTTKWARWGMFLTVLFLVLFVLPLYRYRPTCGEIRFPGPMREGFVKYMEESFIEGNFFYVMIGDELFIRMYNPLYYFNQRPNFNSYDELISNTEKKYGYNHFRGWSGERIAWNDFPEAKAARDEGLAWMRDHADDDPAKHPNAVVLPEESDAYCAKLYALVIRTESMPPDRRLRFLARKKPQSQDKRSFFLFNIRS